MPSLCVDTGVEFVYHRSATDGKAADQAGETRFACDCSVERLEEHLT